MTYGPDAEVMSQWAVPGILFGVILGAIGIALYRITRRTGGESGLFAMVGFVAAMTLGFVLYLSAPHVLRGDARERWGTLFMGTCCATPGIGLFAAGAIWAVARAFRRPPKPDAKPPVDS